MNPSAKALQPSISTLKAKLQAENIQFGDVMGCICAAAKESQHSSNPLQLTCSGNLTIGMFFDGTGWQVLHFSF